MKSISKFFVFFLTTCLLVSVFAVNLINAQPVDTAQAKLVAKNFFADRLSRSSISNIKGISSQNIDLLLACTVNENVNDLNDLNKGSQTLPLYYIFNVRDKVNTKDKNGFIIVSADQRVPAVLGYSFSGEFPDNEQPSAFKDWMNHYKEQIIYVIQNDLKPVPGISEVWKKYSGTIDLKGTEQLTEVAPLLSTRWSQYGFYNNLCPEDSRCGTVALNGHVPAGCVAVAMAQIMKYWNYPVANNPIPGYTSDNYGWQPDIGVTTYNWSSMPAIVDAPMTPSPGAEEIEAVSTIIYHCGVAVEMNYGYLASGAGSPLIAFIDYFKYSPGIEEIDRNAYSDEDWGNILRSEIDNNRPVYYAGYEDVFENGGHAFVCDGYQDDNYFYFNWGLSLGGAGNGYFYINDLTPGSHDFNFNQWAIIGISPDAGSTITDVDGNHYSAVTLGSQTWMVENLKTTRYNNENAIEYPGADNNLWQSNTTGAYAWWGNNIANKDTYGALYNLHAVNSRNLCPVGWHVPTFHEWLDLMSFLGGGDSDYGRQIGGGLLKEAGISHWIDPNTDATDAYGFRALPGGNRTTNGSFFHQGDMATWWSSGFWWNDDTETLGTGFDIFNSSGGVWYGASEKNVGLSVRCLKGPLVVDIPGDAGAFAYGDISTEGEEDWYRFLTGTAGIYAIQTYGSTDTYMYLYDSDRTTLIAEDNDGAGSETNSKIAGNLNGNTWYYVKITGNGNATGSYSIGVNELPEAPTAVNINVTYDGLSHLAGATVPSGISVTWYDAASGGNVTTQPSGRDAGNYAAFAEAVNDATGCSSLLRTQVTLKIEKRLAIWITNASSKTYGDTDPDPLTTGSGSNFVGTDGITATYSRESGETAGEYLIFADLNPVSSLGNYAITNAGTVFTIEKKAATVMPDAASKYCGQADPVFTGTLSGFLPVDEVSATYSRTSGESVEGNPYTISATLSPASILDNYSISYNNASFTIISVMIDASQSSNPVAVGTPGITLGALVSNADLMPVPGVSVWFSVESDNVSITAYPTLTDVSGVASVIIDGLTSMTDVYKVTAMAGSGCGDDAISVAYLAVYDPDGGFVTGGGWITSPPGAYPAEPALTGKANFGFVSKYRKGSHVPDGNTEFRFNAANLHFSSLSYDIGSLVIAGHKALYKGAGIINGTGNYKFLVSAVDGDMAGGGGYDKFRIRIWNSVNNAIVYDNDLGEDENDEPATALGGGSIVIHTAKETASKTIQPDDVYLTVFPNPFTDYIYFDLQLKTDSKVSLEIFDVNGSKLATLYNDFVVALQHYQLEYTPGNITSGMLYYRLVVNGKVMFNGNLVHY